MSAKTAKEWAEIGARLSHEWAKDHDPQKTPEAWVQTIMDAVAVDQRESDAVLARDFQREHHRGADAADIRGNPLVSQPMLTQEEAGEVIRNSSPSWRPGYYGPGPTLRTESPDNCTQDEEEDSCAD